MQSWFATRRCNLYKIGASAHWRVGNETPACRLRDLKRDSLWARRISRQDRLYPVAQGPPPTALPRASTTVGVCAETLPDVPADQPVTSGDTHINRQIAKIEHDWDSGVARSLASSRRLLLGKAPMLNLPRSRRWLRAFICAAPLLFVAADWPQFRGPGSQGTSDESGIPVEWSDDTNVVWKTELPGRGSSSPIILGDRVYLTAYSGYGLDRHKPGELSELKRHLVAVDRANGNIVWDTSVAAKTPEQEYSGFETEHGYASSTPVTDGKQIYAFYGRSGVYAYDLQGRQLWDSEVGVKTHIWGTATSPLLYDNLVIVNASIESDALVALDKSDGYEVWRAEGLGPNWGSPTLVQLPGGDVELVLLVEGSVLGFDPGTGERLWSCKLAEDGPCSTPVSAGGIVYVTGGQKKAVLAIRAGGRGDITDSHVLWKQDVGSNIPSPVLHAGHIYVIDNRGRAYCLDAESGEVLYRERLPKSGLIYASPLAAGDRIYLVTRRRGTFVLPASPEFKVLAKNQFSSDSSQFNASPAIGEGRMFIRSDQSLYCIGDGS